MTPTTYRITVAPFQPVLGGVHTVVGELAPKGFRPDQLCLVGTPASIARLSSHISPTNLAYPHLVANLEPLHIPSIKVPVVASPGPIADILLTQPRLASSSTVLLPRHLTNGDVVLGVHADDHDQYVHAARVMLRHATGDVLSHIFQWPHGNG